MSTLCKYCGVASRNACSDYQHRYLEEELRNCPNLAADERSGALFRAGFTRTAALMDEIEELCRENAKLRGEG